jgi:hypothetical protein
VYSQNEGITDVEITKKKTSPSENTTAVVQLHSKVLRNASIRSFREREWLDPMGVVSTWLIR